MILIKRTNIWGYLKLDSFGVETSFSKSKTEFIDYFHKNNIPTDIPSEKQIIIRSKLLHLDVDFSISFQFSGEKLIAITISPNPALEGRTLDCRYKNIQKALENELGHPHNRLMTIMNLLNPDNRLSYWQRDGIKIEHYLLNRFGMEEIISIKL